MIPIRSIIVGTGKSILTQNTVSCPLFTPFVRWRKRRWAPKASSKEFYVREKPEQDPDEYAELTERYRHYKTYLKSVRVHLKAERMAKKAISESGELVGRETRLYETLMELNDQWNEETRKIREARELQATSDEQEEILNYATALEKEKEVRRKVADERVQFEQAASQNFIGEENLRQEIERALNKQANYNFYIDLTGNRFVEKGDFSAELVTDHTDAQPQVFSQSSEGMTVEQQAPN